VTDEQKKLVEENINLVKWWANRFMRTGADYDELFQEGCLGLCKAALGYDASKGAFKYYAGSAIINQMRLFLRRSRNQQHFIDMDEAWWDYQLDEKSDPEAEALGRLEAKRMLQKMNHNTQTKVVLLALGFNQTEVGKLLQCSRMNVCKAMQRVRRRLNPTP
jgi:RNA polymerase sigma factor (sigma-70 family)